MILYNVICLLWAIFCCYVQYKEKEFPNGKIPLVFILNYIIMPISLGIVIYRVGRMNYGKTKTN